MPSRQPPPARCQAAIGRGQSCRRPAAPAARYCPTHQFLLEPLGPELTSLDLTEELQLIRLQLHNLVASHAPATQILSALRILTVMARLQHRLQHLDSKP